MFGNFLMIFVTLRPIDYTICDIIVFTEFVLMTWAWNLFFLLEYTFFLLVS